MGCWSLVVSFVFWPKEKKPFAKGKKLSWSTVFKKNLNTMKHALSTGISNCDSNADNAMRMHMCNDTVALMYVF